MPTRKILQDMIPSRPAPLKSVGKAISHKKIKIEQVPEHTFVPEEIPKPRPVILERPLPRKKSSYRRHPLIIGSTLLLCLAAIALALSFVYAKATVVVIPKKVTIDLNAVFTACKGTPCTPAAGSKIAPLSYEVIQIPGAELHQIVQAVDGPLVQTSAHGNIILYNNYSATPQTLSAGVHLTNTAGLVYRTTKTVIVPGYKKVGTSTVPGSVSVPIVAAAPGPQYNILPTDLTGDFKFIAYKGTPKYTAFYGRINPNNSIAGGSIGGTKVVASSTLAQVYNDLKQNLTAQLLAQSRALIPQDYIVYDNAYSISYSPIAPSATSTGGAATSADVADVGMRASLSGIMFKQKDLVKTIAQAGTPSILVDTSFPNNAFTTSGLSSLAFTSLTPTASSSAPFRFSLKGTFGLTGAFVVEDIINRLVGKTMAQSNAIFAGYSTIEGAHAIITPFWRHSFPDSPKKISIAIQ